MSTEVLIQQQKARRQRTRLILQTLGLAGLLALFMTWLASSSARQHQLNGRLAEAIYQNDTARVRALLNQGADPNTRLPEDTSFARDFESFFHRLITGAPLPPDTTFYRPSIVVLAFHRADPAQGAPAQSENLALIRALLDKGADVNARDRAGDTLLVLALRAGYSDTARLLLDRGADVNARDLHGLTPLMGIPYDRLDGRLSLLLDRGADVNAVDNFRTTLLMHVCSSLHPDLAAVKQLLDRGADVDARSMNRSTALMFAAQAGHTALVKLLLERRADVNARDAAGQSALFYAANSRQEPVLQVLLQQGAAVNIRANSGHTALYCAEQNHLFQSVRQLKQLGAQE